MSRKQKKMLIRILVAAALLIALHFIPVAGIPRFVLYLVPYFVIGYDILLNAFHQLHIDGTVVIQIPWHWITSFSLTGSCLSDSSLQDAGYPASCICTIDIIQ